MFLKKRKKEFGEREIEQIVKEYSEGVESLLQKYLPRKMRRFIFKGRGRRKFSSNKKIEEIQRIKETGVGAWLNRATEEILEELSSFVSNPDSLNSELDVMLKELKKRWNIRT